MDKPLFDLLNTVKLMDVIVTTALFVAIIGVLIHQRKNIKSFLERWRAKRNFEDTIMESINGLHETDKNLKSQIDKLENTMLDARETSKSIRGEMYDDIKTVSRDVKNITVVLDNMQKKEELSKQAHLREKIERIYRECSNSRRCTDMQFQTLKDLIKDYERYNGKNSFVHSIVEKEMYSWEIIKRIPDDEKNDE